MTTTTTTMTMVIVLHHDCTVSSSSLSNPCDGADPSLHGCGRRLACVQAGLPAERPSFSLRRVRTRRRTGKNMNVKKKEFSPFLPGSQCFLTMFPLSSQWVHIRFPFVPQVPNVFPKLFSTAPHFYPRCFWQMLSSFHTWYYVGPKERNSIPQNRTF
jgi:hypothetical protein